MAKESKEKEKKEPPHYAGHRKRLRARFLEAGADALEDYELIELLLFSAIPRQDVKALAKKLLTEFKSLWAILNAPRDRLLAVGLSERAAATLLVVGAVTLRAQRGEVMGLPLLNNWQRVLDYCRLAMAHEPVEQFRLLFLDRKNKLLAEEILQKGTIDHAPVYPREIVKRALDVGAGALILAHNHPSGDPSPSKEDIAMTNAILAACNPLGIVDHDHLIVGREKIASFKQLGLL